MSGIRCQAGGESESNRVERGCEKTSGDNGLISEVAVPSTPKVI